MDKVQTYKRKSCERMRHMYRLSDTVQELQPTAGFRANTGTHFYLKRTIVNQYKQVILDSFRELLD